MDDDTTHPRRRGERHPIILHKKRETVFTSGIREYHEG